MVGHRPAGGFAFEVLDGALVDNALNRVVGKAPSAHPTKIDALEAREAVVPWIVGADVDMRDGDAELAQVAVRVEILDTDHAAAGSAEPIAMDDFHRAWLARDGADRVRGRKQIIEVEPRALLPALGRAMDRRCRCHARGASA
jgi:hypothetical protein